MNFVTRATPTHRIDYNDNIRKRAKTIAKLLHAYNNIIVTGLILNITFKMTRLKFGDSLVIRQTAKLKSPPNKPRIRYINVTYIMVVVDPRLHNMVVHTKARR